MGDMDYNIRIGKDHFLFIAVFAVIITGIGIITAYDSGNPLLHGHDANEIANVSAGSGLRTDCTSNQTVKWDGDSWECANDTGSCSLGAWVPETAGNNHQATTDGFVVAQAPNLGQDTDLLGYTDSNPTPSTIRDRAGVSAFARGAGISFPVKANDYWRVDTLNGVEVHWIPLECSDAGGSAAGGGFDAWEDKSINTVYQAVTDGFVVATGAASNGNVEGYTDGSNPPATVVAHDTAGQNLASMHSSITFPVKKGDYWRVLSTTGTVKWIPLIGGGSGSGSLNCTTVSDQRSTTGSTHSVSCPGGTFVTGGGCGPEGNLVVQTRPNGNGWYCEKNLNGLITVYAICCNIA